MATYYKLELRTAEYIDKLQDGGYLFGTVQMDRSGALSWAEGRRPVVIEKIGNHYTAYVRGTSYSFKEFSELDMWLADHGFLVIPDDLELSRNDEKALYERMWDIDIEADRRIAEMQDYMAQAVKVLEETGRNIWGDVPRTNLYLVEDL